MAMKHRAPAWLALLAALTGCAGGAAPVSGTGWVAGGEERLTLPGAASAQRAVRFDDGSGIEEYGRAAGGGWDAEYLYLIADSGDRALTGSLDIARASVLFRRLINRVAILGEPGEIERPEGTIAYRPIGLASTSCFVFAGDWPGRPDECPDQALLGYACRPGDRPPAPAAVETFLAGLTVQPAVTPDHLPALPAAAGALSFALGQDRPESGLIGYPIDLAGLSSAADGELL